MLPELLFKVISGDHKYEIYTDGTTRGFDEGALIVNYLDLVMARGQKQQHPQQPDLQSHEAEPNTEPHRAPR